jgi:hypothetical protein
MNRLYLGEQRDVASTCHSELPRTFYLNSINGDANGVFRSGTLTETQPKEGSDKFTYDPLNTREASR